MAITPASPVLALGRNKTVTAVAYDAAGAVVPDVTFAWTSSNPAVVHVAVIGGNTGQGDGARLRFGDTDSHVDVGAHGVNSREGESGYDRCG